MKETKVYVDEEPRKIATQLVDLENEQFNCVMLLFDTDIKPVEVVIDPKLKTHDRELVKEVCEKIKVWCENIENWTNDCNHRVLSLDELNKFLNQIKKDIENG